MMPATELPATNLVVSCFVLGTARIGVAQDEAEAHELLDHFVACGGNCIDTARVYSDWVPGERGRAERILGEWLRARPALRPRLVIATKGLHYEWSDKSRCRVTMDDARRDIETSRRVLGIDTIDLFFLHRDDPRLPVEAIVDFMQPFVTERQVRYLGASNWAGERIAAANDYARRAGLHGFVANQTCFNLGCWTARPPGDRTLVGMDHETYAWHEDAQLPVFAYSAQAGGIFTKILTDSRADAAWGGDRYASATNVRLATLVGRLAEQEGCNANAIVLAYLLNQPFPVFPLLGSDRVDQLDDSLAALVVKLSSDDMRALEEASGSGVSRAR